MKRHILTLVFCGILVFIVDQYLKQIFLDGFRAKSEYIDLVLTFNKGVAFSMFAFLGVYLKYIQTAMLLALFLYVIFTKELLVKHSFPFGLVLGAGSSNVYDRFIHGGVVDYVFWHKWFNFAVFNFADVMIDFAIFLILLQSFLEWRKERKKSII